MGRCMAAARLGAAKPAGYMDRYSRQARIILAWSVGSQRRKATIVFENSQAGRRSV